MSNYDELKRLAEQATPGPWKAQHPNAGQRGSEVAGADGLNQVCADLGPTNSLYIAAANPAAVLALIAENEQLTKDLESHKRMLLRAACDLGAGGEALGAEMDDDASELEGIALELRKDAERYKWTSTEGNWVARFHGKWRAHVGAYGDAQPTEWYPSREEAIDAAMGKGDQS